MIPSCSDSETLLQSNGETCKLINNQGNVLASHSRRVEKPGLADAMATVAEDDRHLWLFETPSCPKPKSRISRLFSVR